MSDAVKCFPVIATVEDLGVPFTSLKAEDRTKEFVANVHMSRSAHRPVVLLCFFARCTIGALRSLHYNMLSGRDVMREKCSCCLRSTAVRLSLACTHCRFRYHIPKILLSSSLTSAGSCLDPGLKIRATSCDSSALIDQRLLDEAYADLVVRGDFSVATKHLSSTTHDTPNNMAKFGSRSGLKLHLYFKDCFVRILHA